MKKRKRLLTGFSSLTSFLLVASILGTNTLMAYEGTVNSYLGIETSKIVNEGDINKEDTTYYESEYGELNAENLQKLIADSYAEAVLEQEEGSVLLKNDNNALPLNQGAKVTLFGHAIVQPLYKNASAGSNGYKGPYNIDLYSALTTAGFEINDTLFEAYKNSKTSRSSGVAAFGQEETPWDMGEESIDFYTDDLRASWDNNYNDVAIVMLAREAGEGTELYIEDPAEGISQLALHQEEKDLLQMIKESGKFKKTIVLVNSGNAMELGWLDDYNVDACLWIGLPGQRGFEGVANLLVGAANPSGSLVSTFAKDSTSAPAVVNASFNNQQFSNVDEIVKQTGEQESEIAWYNAQAEGIYLGYKYYETRYEDLILGRGNAESKKGSSTGNAWNYNDEVSYPFGYGLSYTMFEQKLDKVTVDDDKVIAEITVTNTGDVAGKSIVELYAQTPYGDYEIENKVEKSSIQLLNFAKTKQLEPGESETLTIEGNKYLLASYDYTNAKTYILSEGTYYLSVGDDAHDALNNILAVKNAKGMVDVLGNEVSGDKDKVYQWDEAFDDKTYAVSPYTGEVITNQFEDADLNYWIKDSITYLSRNDWDATYPVEAVKIEATVDMMNELQGDYYVKADDAPSMDSITLGENQGIALASMIGKDFDDPEWQTYLDQFTLEELASQTADSFGTKEIASVGKQAIQVGDGPDGVGGTVATFNKEKYGDDRDSTAFPSETVLASTFNKDLLKRRGELLAEEAMYLGFAELWAPGGNLHRTPFGGRNFEYYSEDANLNYLMEEVEVAAIESKGIIAGVKHLTGNDQENNRQGISIFTNEQAFREGDLRGVEGALTVGGGRATMHAFNRIGMRWASSHETLLTHLLSNEWGFNGHSETDAVAGGGTYRHHYASSLAAGTHTYCLDFSGASSREIARIIKETDDGYLLGKLRDAVHRYLFAIVHSPAMNGQSINSKVVSVTPWWKPLSFSIIALLALIDLVLIYFIFKKDGDSLVEVEKGAL